MWGRQGGGDKEGNKTSHGPFSYRFDFRIISLNSNNVKHIHMANCQVCYDAAVEWRVTGGGGRPSTLIWEPFYCCLLHIILALMTNIWAVAGEYSTAMFYKSCREAKVFRTERGFPPKNALHSGSSSYLHFPLTVFNVSYSNQTMLAYMIFHLLECFIAKRR